MTLNFENKDNFYESIKDCSENSLNFENCCESEPYINEEVESANISNLGLILYDIPFITKYFDKIKENTNSIMLTEMEQMTYYRNPKLLSYDKLGSIDYWYLILLLNEWFSAYDMTDLGKSIILPNPKNIADIITEEEFIKK